MQIHPATGDNSDPGKSARTWSFVGALMVGLFGLIVCGFLAPEVYTRRHRLRWWLDSWAWWRPPQPTPAATASGWGSRG